MNPRKSMIPMVLIAFACVSSVWSGHATRVPEQNPGDLKQAAKWMNQGQTTLFQAIRLAEKRINGRAVAADCELRYGAVNDVEGPPNPELIIKVCCVVEGEIIDVKIDGRNRKIIELKLRDLPREPLASNQE